MYAGTQANTAVQIQQGQSLYLRAKACNDGGCSAYSPQTVANTYFNVCH